MALQLTPQEAAAKIVAIDESMARARSLVAKLQSETDTMLGSSWHGVSAGKFGNTQTANHDDYNVLIQTLTDVAEKGKTHIQRISTTDEG
ncbi:WXG100 family type VII secretion target [Mycobacterium sp. CPCC 205372]|uniref:WXG100 family type VII secretion target n=1 Tax=Mycobacterium hippophais TaxID=3016340 RepID=A0ABT4PUF8_9MYCO|nr:WXG100 family type VII secretion target [Mycobacterium hippophais]MCZ8380191.1 WXG100 family type VII secretion target [Mycobacterium hippophais]